ncbi:HlyD family type I secretion periplasmic adaptor subunit [Gymnodinialimonas sp. 2305UL16-5]|uniref:HlyD family type I secretion periplasmic adaptor subunit n=1 Tax=Gymnodinialimonas mytili TaxID=3126503 RepID=UPI0030A69384
MSHSLTERALRGPIAKAQRHQKKRGPRLAAFLALNLSALVGGLIILASHTIVPQITRATGTLVPVDNYTQIETMEGGIVDSVHVRDGAIVEAGDSLIALENPNLNREIATLTEQLDALATRSANAQAILSLLERGGTIEPSDINALTRAGLSQAAAALDVFADTQRIQLTTIQQQRDTIAILEQAEALALERVVRVDGRLDGLRSLLTRGVITQPELRDAEDQADAFRIAASDAAVRLTQARSALTLAIAEMHQAALALREQMLSELANVTQMQAELRATQGIALDRLQSLQIDAPASGIVQAVAFPNVGEVIAPGETIFELLPLQETLIVEARIPNTDIGHVGAGDTVSISIDTFDPRRYGRVDGTIASISPVPIIDEQTGAALFRASIALQTNMIGTGHFERPLIAGMNAVAEIQTGEQTLLSYLLRPIQSTLQRSFIER